MTSCKGVLNTVGAVARARRKSVKKRRLFVLNEHFIRFAVRFAVRFAAVLKHIQPRDCEQIFSPALATQVIIQHFRHPGWKAVDRRI